MQLFTVFIISLFLTIAIVPIFKRIAIRMNIVDEPDARKVHLMPMPKTGGISMAIGAFIPMLIWAPKDNFFSAVLVGSVIIVFFGLLDDIKQFSASKKILPQIAAALVVIMWGGVKINCLGVLAAPDCILPDFLSIPLTLFVILGVTNAINLADGLDGLAGGISMLSFVLIAFLSFQCGNMQVAVMSIAMVGGIAGFLRYNTHPAILFMGDAGSQLLGFLSVILAIVITQTNAPYSKIMALPLIGFPILDTLTVMTERIIKKRSPFKADKKHFHHRLMRFGFFHREAVLIIYVIQSLYIGLALIFRFYSGWVHLLGFLILSLMVLGGTGAALLTGWHFRRGAGFDTEVKSRLKVLKERKIFIRVAFGGLKILFPLLLAMQILIPAQIPIYFSCIAAVLLFVIASSYFFKNGRYKELGLRFSTYLIVPLLLYMTQSSPGLWMDKPLNYINNFSFLVLVFFVISTLNLTRRSKGFKISTMDILVFIIILIFPNLPSIHLMKFDAGMTLAKSLVMFFSYDVLVGELRGETGSIIKPSVCILALLVIRGFI